MRNVFYLLLSCSLACLPACESDSTSSEPGGEAGSPGEPDVGGDEGPGEPEPEPVVPLEPPPEGEGFQIEMTAVAPAGEEVWICKVGPMPNTEVANVSWVEVQQNPGTHHLTLSTLGLTGGGKLPHGTYDCNDLYGDKSLMEDQIMFYGNQGVGEETMHLPDGVAATFPPGLDLIHELHYVNPTFEDVELYSRVNAHTIPSEKVVDGIWGGSVRDEHINIPAGADEYTEWSRCVMNRDVTILFLASHTHELGVSFKIRPFDGDKAGEVIYENNDWHVPQIVQYEEGIEVPKGQGFEWSCTWKNPHDRLVEYGLEATDEMCNLAVVFKPFDPAALCEVVETSDGVLWSP